MRKTNTDEIDFNIRFALGRAGNSWYQTLAGQDHAKRQAAAQHLCEAIIGTFRDPMFFGADSMPVEQAAIEATICEALLELGPLTYNAARRSHQETRRQALAIAAERVMERIGPVEILVADPLKGHGDRVTLKAV